MTEQIKKPDATEWLKARKHIKFDLVDFHGIENVGVMSLSEPDKAHLISDECELSYDEALLYAADLGLACDRLRAVENENLELDLPAFWEWAATESSMGEDFYSAFGQKVLELSGILLEVNERYEALEQKESQEALPEEEKDEHGITVHAEMLAKINDDNNLTQ